MLLLIVNLVIAKQYTRCELAKELYKIHGIAEEDVGTLVCIAEKPSGLDTRSYNNENYGLLKVNFNINN